MSYHPVKTWRPMHYMVDQNYAVHVANTRGSRSGSLGLGRGYGGRGGGTSMMPMRYRDYSNYFNFPINYSEHLDYVATPLSGDSGDGLGGLGNILAVL